MRNKAYDNMFYLCFIVERMFRATKIPHRSLINKIGIERLRHYYNFAEVFHCENPDKVVGDLAVDIGLDRPPLYHELENESSKPPYSKMAKSAARVINAVSKEDYVQGVYDYYNSFLPPLLNIYKNNLYWSSKEYLVACYLEGEIL